MTAWLDVAGATDSGRVRANNEDDFFIDRERGLFVVADGMGGHNSGEVASALATRTLRDCARLDRASAASRARRLEDWIRRANSVIYEKGRAFPQDAGMGTTVVAVLADPGSMTVAHVGDSRAYLFRDGRLRALTADHSLPGLQNVLTRAVGAEKDVRVDVAEHSLAAGDVVLLVSDGLTKMVDDSAIAEAAARGDRPRALVYDLVARALNAGGEDNVTVVAARVAIGGGLLRRLSSRLLGGWA
ncbi:MAG: serine/threonine-protein phosphatase [Elusimicrobia bacterium]|nr:serine/threonine-protein phosphatase [Elusimicrobiota bacterium]MDE2426142.1 serine/threonine-protein phosphatase [Elusimicrobiota bacterium]